MRGPGDPEKSETDRRSDRLPVDAAGASACTPAAAVGDSVAQAPVSLGAGVGNESIVDTLTSEATAAPADILMPEFTDAPPDNADLSADGKGADTGADTDASLMLAYASGDTAAFDQLYQRHRNGLYRFFLNGTGSDALANELYQDVWERVIRHRDRYQTDARFTTWLYTIARNCLTDHYRRQRKGGVAGFASGFAAGFAVSRWRRQSHTDNSTASAAGGLHPAADANPDTDDIADEALGPEAVAALLQQRGVLQQALQQLSEVQREAILLKHVAGMRLSEIADVCQEKPETVKSRLRYATRLLRHSLRAST